MKLSFWYWFFKDNGYKKIIDKYIFIHILVGILLNYLVPLSLKECANVVFLPFIGILTGVSFAWAGNALGLMQASEISELSKYREGGLKEYVYTYQVAILIIIITLVFWGFAGLSIFDYLEKNKILYAIIKTTLFMFSSLTIRESWHVIMGTQWMLIVSDEIKKMKKEKI
jgi:hypothetical protein